VDALKRIFEEFRLPMALDAKAINAKTLGPVSKISGRINAANLRDGLNELVAPLGPLWG